MNPNDFACPGSLTLKTATLLLFALATMSNLPAGADGNRAHEIVCSRLPLAVSRTLTLVELAQATYSSLPSGERAISVGCCSVGQVSTTVFFAGSTTATQDFNHSVVQIRFREGSARQAYG